MRRIALFCLMTVASVLTSMAQSVYDFNVVDDNGKEVSLSQYKGKVLLIVNTATKCGFTPQYKELQELYEQYRAQGFEILDFPCNQFGQQAPGSIREIHQFCTANFNIEFPQFDKIEVNGEHAHPLYTFLKSQKGFCGFNTDDKIGRFLDERFKQQDPDYAKNPDIKWNFTKFLVSKDGCVLQRFEPTATAKDMEQDIQAALRANCCEKKDGCCCK
ncbi:MAG: glutathione peroxidase [Prevotella sp.]|nr:glutathione peroxidase [Prevotella sp.]